MPRHKAGTAARVRDDNIVAPCSRIRPASPAVEEIGRRFAEEVDAWVHAAKVMAATALDAIRDPGLLERATAELKERVGEDGVPVPDPR